MFDQNQLNKELFNDVAASNVLARKVESNSTLYEKLSAEIAALKQRLNQLLVDFAELIKTTHTVAVEESGVPVPAPINDYWFVYHFSRPGEIASYVAGLALLSFLLYEALDAPVIFLGLLVVGIIVIFAAYFPGSLAVLAGVKARDAQSVKPVIWSLILGVVLTVAGLLAFSFTRSSSDADGLAAIIYGFSGPIAELGLAISAAAFRVLRKFYGESFFMAKKFANLRDLLFDKLYEQQRVFGAAVADYTKLLKFQEFRTLNVSLDMMSKLQAAAPLLAASQKEPETGDTRTAGNDAATGLLKEGGEDEE